MILSCEIALRLTWLGITVVAVLLLALSGVSWVMWVHGATNPMMWVPVALLEWSFTGAMLSILFELANWKQIHRIGLELYIWISAKPLLGLLMGSLVFFTALAGVMLLGGGELQSSTIGGRNSWEAALWLNSIAFFVGFTDPLSISRISRYVRRNQRAIDGGKANEYQQRALRRPVNRERRVLCPPPEGLSVAKRRMKESATTAGG